MLFILSAAIAPALILLWYVYHKDINPEPQRLVLKAFLYGALATFVSTLISGPLLTLGYFSLEPDSIWESIKISFLGAAIPEECAKLLMLWLLLRKSAEFDERYDGIVYAAAVGLGFATLENLQYLIAAGADWYSVSISRALFAVPGHFCFAVIMGYYYSQYHFTGNPAAKWKTLLYPVLLHGTYDTIVFSSNLSGILSSVFTLLLLVFCFRLFKSTRRRILAEAAEGSRNYTLIRDSDASLTGGEPDEQ